MEEDDQIGARSAAQRRLELELGVPYQDAPVKDIKFVTRILYEAESNAEWGEHELDYILFLKRNSIDLNPNTDEVQAVEWVGKEHLQDFLKDLESRNVGITPWFKLCTKVCSFQCLVMQHPHIFYTSQIVGTVAILVD